MSLKESWAKQGLSLISSSPFPSSPSVLQEKRVPAWGSPPCPSQQLVAGHPHSFCLVLFMKVALSQVPEVPHEQEAMPGPGWGFLSLLSSDCGSQSLEEEEGEMFCLEVSPCPLVQLLTWGCLNPAQQRAGISHWKSALLKNLCSSLGQLRAARA